LLTRTVVIAVGGNAIAPAGGAGTIAEQFRHTRASLGAVVDLAAEGWRIAIVHGNGPQVGDDLARHEIARDRVQPLPLGMLVAGTQGWMGYMIQQSLQNALGRADVRRQVVTVVTQVRVDSADPALADPTKPVGRILNEADAHSLAAAFGWQVRRAEDGWQRVVPSPQPVSIVESRMIQAIVAAGHVVIAAGGGGTPVYLDKSGTLEGIDAVVDKDRAAAILARDIQADTLLILTDVDRVYRRYGTPEAEPLDRLNVGDAEELSQSGELGTGSMAPKVEAAARFVREGGRRAIIARLDAGRDAVTGRAGTEIVA
jgi:carbamate kinase